MFDDPAFDWNDYLLQQNRQASAAGGVDPAPNPMGPDDGPNLDDNFPPGLNTPSVPAPSAAQTALAAPVGSGGFGIKTTGPAADAATTAAQGYRAGVDQAEHATGQGAPQQFGTPEPKGQDQGPLDPAVAADRFMALNPTPEAAESNVEKHMLGYGDRSEQNKAYQERVDADRATREQEKLARDERAAKNRAAAREKDSDMWAQFRDLNAVQGGGGGARGDMMPGVTRQGGFAFVGPGGGKPYFDYNGRGGAGRFDPFEAAKVELRRQELLRLQKKDATTADLGNKKVDLAGQRQKTAQQQVDDAMKRFNDKEGDAKEKSAHDLMSDLQVLSAEYDRRDKSGTEAWATGGMPAKIAAADAGIPRADPSHPGRWLPGEPRPGSFNSLKRRILDVVTQLNEHAANGRVNLNVTPQLKQMIMSIMAEQGADQMTPLPRPGGEQNAP